MLAPEKDKDGLWWVVKNGTRVSFRTRKEARLYMGHASSAKPADPGDLDPAYFHRLSPIEARIASLRWQGASQAEIALRVSLTQPSVAYHLRRASWRIKVLKTLPDIEPKELLPGLTRLLGESHSGDIGLLLDFITTASQSKVARMHHLSQGCIRHRLLRVMDRLRTLDPENLGLRMAQIIFAHPNVFYVSNEADAATRAPRSAEDAPSHP